MLSTSTLPRVPLVFLKCPRIVGTFGDIREKSWARSLVELGDVALFLCGFFFSVNVFLVRIELAYNIVLTSVIEQHDLTINIHVPFLNAPKSHPTFLGCHTVPH